MYATVRRYEGVSNPLEAATRVREGFVPIIAALPGLVEYDWVDLGQDAMLSISVFDGLPNAIESNQAAAAWVRDNLSSVLTQKPRIEGGQVVAYKNSGRASRPSRGTTPAVPAPSAPSAAGSASGSVIERLNAFAAQRVQHFQRHVTVRRYEDVTNPQEAAKQVGSGFVPLISALPGFLAYYWVDLGNGGMLSVSIFDSLSNAIESGHAAADWVRTNLPAVLRKSPRIEAGKVVATI